MRPGPRPGPGAINSINTLAIQVLPVQIAGDPQPAAAAATDSELLGDSDENLNRKSESVPVPRRHV